MAEAGQNRPRHNSESVYFTVQSCETTFELWKKLSETYEKKVASTKMYLIRRLYSLRMKDSDSVQAHLNEYESLSSQITSQGMTIEDELRAMILMSSLPSSWETFVTTVVVQIFVHGRKTERSKQTRDVHRCTSTCCILSCR